MGRPMLEVRRQSFALTLYTHWHLQQWEAREAFHRALEQHDLAVLVAHAHHAPKELSNLRASFMTEHTVISQTEDQRRQAIMRAHISAHSRMRQLAEDVAGAGTQGGVVVP